MSILRNGPWAFGAKMTVLIWLMTLVATVPAFYVSFTYPPKPTPGSSLELTADVLDSVVVSWTSDYNHAWLYVYCNTSAGNDLEKSKSIHPPFTHLLTRF